MKKQQLNTTSEAAVRESEHDVRLKIQPVSESTNRVTGEKNWTSNLRDAVGSYEITF